MKQDFEKSLQENIEDLDIAPVQEDAMEDSTEQRTAARK